MQDIENTAAEEEQATKPKQTYLKWVLILWSVFIGGIAIVLLLFILISEGKLGVMPTFEELENPFISQASVIYSEDGEELGSYFIENRKDVDFRELSPKVVNALDSTEDIR